MSLTFSDWKGGYITFIFKGLQLDQYIGYYLSRIILKLSVKIISFNTITIWIPFTGKGERIKKDPEIVEE